MVKYTSGRKGRTALTILEVTITILSKDFTREQKRDFTIRKEIIWESETSSIEELNKIEMIFIEKFQSN